MNAQSLNKAFVPLSGGATAVYTSAGLDHYRHSDWLGSNRLSSTPSRTVQWSGAYGPWGELYASSPSGSSDPSFTGQNSDTSSTGEYDFLYRQYGTQGRWPTPDPAGLGAANPENPQSWNRYAYVLNNPLTLTDPTGLYCVYFNEVNGIDVLGRIAPGDCDSDSDNGYYVDGTVTGIVTSGGQVVGVTLNGGNEEWPVGFDYNSTSAYGGNDSAFEGVTWGPAPPRLHFDLTNLATGPVGTFTDHADTFMTCSANALLDEIPFGSYLGAQSPDKVSGKLRLSGAALSPNPDKKWLGIVPSNYALNTERAVNTLDKLDLPQIAEGVGAAAAKAAPYITPWAKWLGPAGWAFTAGHMAYSTAKCYKSNKQVP